MQSCLSPDTWTSLRLKSRVRLNTEMAVFVFAIPVGANHTGLMPGQYVKVFPLIKLIMYIIIFISVLTINLSAKVNKIIIFISVIRTIG